MKFMDPIEPLHVNLNKTDFEKQTIYFPSIPME